MSHEPTTRIVSDPARVLAFVQSIMPMNWCDGMKTLGLERGGQLVAGVVYEGFNGVNVWMHVAAQPGKHWLNRAFLNYCFHYPFQEMNCRRVSAYVEASNHPALRFDEALGFRREAVLSGAAADGGDVIILAMTKQECRYGR